MITRIVNFHNRILLLSKARLIIVSLSLLLSLASCFTGIEGTKRITLSKEDKREIRSKEEELFLADIVPPVVADWETGKQFFVTDNRASLLFTREYISDNVAGDTLGGQTIMYENYESVIQPDGSKRLTLIFCNNGRRLRYNTNKPDSAVSSFSSTQIPMLIDIDLTHRIAEKLKSRKLWTLSNLWYDCNGVSVNGRRFEAVNVTNVYPANDVFPMRVEFTDERGDTASVYMNFGNNGIDSRAFASIFSLTDVRKSYPHISSEIWELIRTGSVRAGMTKEECRLSLGNPSDIDSGRDWNFTRELWQYPGGIYLEFEDGILKNYRR